MAEYYDRQGNPMSMVAWTFATRGRVAETTLPNGRWVSTIWLGINHQYGDGPPLIFETMVFPSKDNMGELECDRYSTEAEALAGHAKLVEKWTIETPVEA